MPETLTEVPNVEVTASTPIYTVHDDCGIPHEVSDTVENRQQTFWCGRCENLYLDAFFWRHERDSVRDIHGERVFESEQTHIIIEGHEVAVCGSCRNRLDFCVRCQEAVEVGSLLVWAREDRDGYLEEYEVCARCHATLETRHAENQRRRQRRSVEYRDWQRGPFDGDDEDGEYIKTSRTVGIEYEMMGHGHCDGVLPEVGIGSDPTANIEVRTPPAKGKAADRFTKHTLAKLLENGWTPGYEAGLHVHVHFPEASTSFEQPSPTYNLPLRCHACGVYHTNEGDVTELPSFPASDGEVRVKNVNRARFAALWLAVEDVAYMFDPERVDNEYSSAIIRYSDEREGKVSEALEYAHNGMFLYDYGRYVSANLGALETYRTVEFRCHGSIGDPDHVAAWVAFVQAMVDLSLVVDEDDITNLASIDTIDEKAHVLLHLLTEKHNILTAKAANGVAKVVLRELATAVSPW